MGGEPGRRAATTAGERGRGTARCRPRPHGCSHASRRTQNAPTRPPHCHVCCQKEQARGLQATTAPRPDCPADSRAHTGTHANAAWMRVLWSTTERLHVMTSVCAAARPATRAWPLGSPPSPIHTHTTPLAARERQPSHSPLHRLRHRGHRCKAGAGRRRGRLVRAGGGDAAPVHPVRGVTAPETPGGVSRGGAKTSSSARSKGEGGEAARSAHLRTRVTRVFLAHQ